MAQFLGVPPWDLLDRTAAWVHIGIAVMNAEAHARKMKEKMSK